MLRDRLRRHHSYLLPKKAARERGASRKTAQPWKRDLETVWFTTQIKSDATVCYGSAYSHLIRHGTFCGQGDLCHCCWLLCLLVPCSDLLKLSIHLLQHCLTNGSFLTNVSMSKNDYHSSVLRLFSHCFSIPSVQQKNC